VQKLLGKIGHAVLKDHGQRRQGQTVGQPAPLAEFCRYRGSELADGLFRDLAAS
jgi:hypothetical protein